MPPKVNSHGLYFDPETQEMVCAHLDAYVERACCSPFAVGPSGYIECGCGGVDGVVCPNPHCTGLLEHEIEAILEANYELPVRSGRR